MIKAFCGEINLYAFNALALQLYDTPPITPIPPARSVIDRCESCNSCKLKHTTVTSLTDNLCKMTHHEVTRVTHLDTLYSYLINN